VLRFGFGGLGLHRVSYLWGAGNHASGTWLGIADSSTVEGRRRSAWVDGERRVDVALSGRLATDD
jgi:hypothetical protein